MSDQSPVDQRVAIVTGASEGIGLSIAQRLLADGFAVALVARSEARLRNTIGEAESRPDILAVAADLGASDAGDTIVSAVLDRFQRIDAIVHCASATRFGAVLELSDRQWVDGFSVKVFGALRLIRAAWPSLRAMNGCVVNIGGIGARTPRAATAMTGPLSAALMAITKVFADQGISDGVRVNAVNPGPILTPRLLGMLEEKAKASGSTIEAMIAAMVAQAEALRIGTPEDVAALISYMLSPAADLMHGALIDLDGGITKGL